MIKKIISGGQTGADQAALDFAIEMSIPHGGWIPKGRKTEKGPLPEKYQLQEMPTSSYPARTEQNVIDSHGTLIVSHGKLTGGSANTLKMAEKHKRPCLHIDLNETGPFLAGGKFINWLHANAIETLNVAGPRASKDPNIYADTLKLLKTAYYMATVRDEMPDPMSDTPNLPKTVDEAKKRLIEDMSLKDKTKLANMKEEDLPNLHTALGTYIRDRFGLWSGNRELQRSCQSIARESGFSHDLREDECSSLIIRELWKALRKTHAMRAVK